jgi:hypothetical protein
MKRLSSCQKKTKVLPADLIAAKSAVLKVLGLHLKNKLDL